MNKKHKKLTRSKSDRIFAGVLGGMGEYFNIDPTLVRILFIVFLAFTGFFPGVVAYLVAAIVIPKGK